MIQLVSARHQAVDDDKQADMTVCEGHWCSTQVYIMVICLRKNKINSSRKQALPGVTNQHWESTLERSMVKSALSSSGSKVACSIRAAREVGSRVTPRKPYRASKAILEGLAYESKIIGHTMTVQ